MSPLFEHPLFLPLAAFLSGALLAWIVARATGRAPVLRSQLATRLEELQQAGETIDSQNQELRQLDSELARLEESNRHLREQVEQGREDLSDLLAQNRGEFTNLARKILDEQSKQFSRTSRDQLGQLLVPFRERIAEFRDRVEHTHESQGERFAALRQELAHLRDLNRKISEDATNLTQALRGESQVQGAWGEVILERLLEQSGLRKGSEYFTQETHQTEIDGDAQRVRPDVIVKLPGERHVIIDSKVSLKAYADHVNCSDPDEIDEAVRRHLDSLRAHLKGLSRKNYQDIHLLSSLDFVLLFIPIEGALQLALQQDPTLHDQAFRQNIALVTPSTLLVTLRIIENLWKQDKQNRHALEIAEEAGKLYDKFVGFTDDLARIEQTLTQAQSACASARQKLTLGKGNLASRAQKLLDLGARANISLPPAFQPDATDSADDSPSGDPT